MSDSSAISEQKQKEERLCLKPRAKDGEAKLSFAPTDGIISAIMISHKLPTLLAALNSCGKQRALRIMGLPAKAPAVIGIIYCNVSVAALSKVSIDALGVPITSCQMRVAASTVRTSELNRASFVPTSSANRFRSENWIEPQIPGVLLLLHWHQRMAPHPLTPLNCLRTRK